MKKIFYFIPALGYYGLVYYISSRNYKLKIDIPLLKFGAHFFEYTIFSILIFFGFSRVFKSRRFTSTFTFTFIKIFATLFVGTFFALADEFHQQFVPGRYTDLNDVLVDGAGVIFGILLYLFFSRGIRLRVNSGDYKS